MRIPTKFPTIIGLLLVVLVVGSVVFFVERVLRSPSTASGSQEPNAVRSTNITDTSFTVSWTTQLPATGTILVSTPKKNNEIYYDERDTVEKTLGSYTTHSIIVRNTSPDTTHSVVILSNGQKYLDNGTPYLVHTATTLTPISGGLEPSYGTVKTADNQPAMGAIVYVTVQGGQTLSSLVKSSGLWLIPLSLLRTEDLMSYLPTVDRMNEDILIVYNGDEATATTDTLNDSPVPDMYIGKAYDFRKQQAKTTGKDTLAIRLPTQNTTPTLGTGAVLGQTTRRTFSVSLISPAQDAALTTSLPFIQGTGIPSKFVGIMLGITNPTNGSTQVGPDGVWNFTPLKPLGPGKQSVTISTVDNVGKPVAITHTFKVLKSGSQVLGDATPSATPVVTETPTPIEVPTSTLAGVPVPNTGSQLPTILLLLLSIAFLTSGAIVTLR
ncbi:hypothetical protein A2Z00_01025 [Candidatus Gottesmanbacteria bacterium RBG_13_45_10]|uniref:Fibronectin type-III domain-containing protein n=1 Tax=Candidatus Gottesmanbacteria bacterium RBG_13_45_10 TaxID=1798370 RepID=A0A1F5ZGJ8_9BACT|nr:MAG: hypothetical protein A2Z00_01025 [Candidatus Gottesmanbacteria bacterium RBG_13_45_10]